MSFNLERTNDLVRHLGLTELPIGVFYTDVEPEGGVHPQSGFAPRDEDLKDVDFDELEHIYPCVLAYVRRTRRRGVPSWFDAQHFGCGGGGFYLRLTDMAPHVPEFVSTGRPGMFEGEKYVRSPELMRKFVEEMGVAKTTAKYCVFKRVDTLLPHEEPLAVVFFATPDQLAGLFGVAGFAAEDWQAVWTPFGAACASIVHYPIQENDSEHPRAVLGTFDVSARPFIEADRLSFAVPRKLYDKMLELLDDTFVRTKSWSRVLKRIARR